MAFTFESSGDDMFLFDPEAWHHVPQLDGVDWLDAYLNSQ